MEILYWWQVYDSRFEEQQRKKHDVRNRFLPWALGGGLTGGTQRTTGLMVRYEVVKVSRYYITHVIRFTIGGILVTTH